MKKLVFFAVTFMAFVAFSGCGSKKSDVNNAQEEVNLEDEGDGDPKPVKRYGNGVEYDTVKPHSQIMRRYLKKDEYSTTIETKIGDCTFVGVKPSHKTEAEGMTIYHDGSLKSVGVFEGQMRWEGGGDVWVIYHDPKVIGKNNFIITGRIEERIDPHHK